MLELKIRLSNEIWENVLNNDDKNDVDSILMHFLIHIYRSFIPAFQK